MEVGFGPYNEDLQIRVYLGGESFCDDAGVNSDSNIGDQQPETVLGAKDNGARAKKEAHVLARTPSPEFRSTLNPSYWPGHFYGGVFGSAAPPADSSPLEACGSPVSRDTNSGSHAATTFAFLSRAMHKDCYDPTISDTWDNGTETRKEAHALIRTPSPEFRSTMAVSSWPGNFYGGVFGSTAPLAESTPFEACESPRSSDKPRSPQDSTITFLARAMNKVLPTKHTFIHFSSLSEFLGRSSEANKEETLKQQRLTRSSSAPAVMAAKREVHDPSSCRPCAYFLYKKDGCRQGDSCTFCHLCPRGTLKKQKKEKKRMLRAASAAVLSCAPESNDDSAW
eukprot:TRINITY_DN112062_c0_g1_i1.p1 TRINITY_DN112062_c0_g1~~TRINITY_DN112062_c0_g1_i1.p1  ORF type:complete len:338 (-),score=73.48 TRINITY_DN112062_c0_g1_i1:165-1178(-)